MFAFRFRLGPVDVAFTDRAGGVSGGSRGPLDLSLDGPDRAALAEDLRRVLEEFTGFPGSPHASVRQVHGAEVVAAVPTSGSGDGSAPGLPVADGLVTDRRGLVLLVRAADCVPVLLADPDAAVVGAVHAGRAGVAAGVVAAGLAACRTQGARELVAWVGPHVCGRCYEVPEAMRAEVAAAAPQAWAETAWGTPALDLGAAVRGQLEDGGARVVDDAARCTRESEDLHSHRRDGRAAGRMAALVRCR